MYNPQITHSRIKELSKVRKISIGEINKSAGLGENAISQLAKSQDGMITRNLYEIAQCLDCSVDYLLGRTDNPTSHKSQNYAINNRDTIVNGTQANVINNDNIDNEIIELAQLIKSLPIAKRAEAILAVEEIKNRE